MMDILLETPIVFTQELITEVEIVKDFLSEIEYIKDMAMPITED